MAKFSLTDNPLVNYVRNSKDELKKVTWPTRQKVVRDTIIVVALSVGVGAFFGTIDHGFNKALQELLQLRQ